MGLGACAVGTAIYFAAPTIADAQMNVFDPLRPPPAFLVHPDHRDDPRAYYLGCARAAGFVVAGYGIFALFLAFFAQEDGSVR